MLIVLFVILGLLFVIHLVTFLIWLFDDLTSIDLSDYFTTKESSLLFFIPIVGLIIMFIARVAQKFNNDVGGL